jgi:nucleotide-binding universal stress UspA family protein
VALDLPHETASSLEGDMAQQPRIVCAVDGSTGSETAFSYGLAIAKSRGAQLDVVCAIPARKQLRWHVRQTAASFGALRRRAAAEDVDMAVTVQHGYATDVILRHANSPNSRLPELIVLGTRNRRGLERLRMPSVADAVMHQSPSPTLVVRGSSGRDAVVPFHRLLCAIDFSPASMSALDEGFQILRHDGGMMRLLHVVNLLTSTVSHLRLDFASADYTTELAESASLLLQALLPLSPDLYGRVHVQVTAGLVVDEIARAAREMHADLVVIGVTKRGRLARLLASTTGLALRRLECPVLAVPQTKSTLHSHADRVVAAA